MKIAVLASHALESIPASGNNRVVCQNMSEFLQFGRIFDKDGRGVESEPSSASATPMDVDGVGNGKRKGCFECGRPGHAAKDCKFNQAKGQGKTKSTATDKNSPAKFGRVSPLWQERSRVGRLPEAKDKKVHAVDGAPLRRWR